MGPFSLLRVTGHDSFEGKSSSFGIYGVQDAAGYPSGANGLTAMHGRKASRDVSGISASEWKFTVWNYPDVLCRDGGGKTGLHALKTSVTAEGVGQREKGLSRRLKGDSWRLTGKRRM